jgi:hypothetical protein
LLSIQDSLGHNALSVDYEIAMSHYRRIMSRQFMFT